MSFGLTELGRMSAQWKVQLILLFAFSYQQAMSQGHEYNWIYGLLIGFYMRKSVPVLYLPRR